MSEQNDGQVSTLQRPTTDDPKLWKEYWKAAQPKEWFKAWGYWRVEPEIDTERQIFLTRRRAIVPDIEKGIYPFKDTKLNRADVEWLLAKHENGRGPVDWGDKSQRIRQGIDIRGSDISCTNLEKLPLARTHAGLPYTGHNEVIDEQRSMARVFLGEANLKQAHLEGALLGLAHLENACLREAKLEDADLSEAYLTDADLFSAHLEHTDFFQSHLERTKLMFTQAAQVDIDFLKEIFESVDFRGAWLEDADLTGAQLSNAQFEQAYLGGACLLKTHLERAHLFEANLEYADLTGAFLQKAHLQGTHLENADLSGAYLEDVELDGVMLSNEMHVGPRIADVRWWNTNLATINWSQVKVLGDEYQARQKNENDSAKDQEIRLTEYEVAVRANRQLAVALQAQGLDEHAARFTYRAQLMQRKVLWLQRKFGQYLFSLLLDLIAGYGYRFRRSFIAYLVVIAAFAIIYFFIGRTVGPFLSPLGAFVFSMTSFHGRGFFPGGIGLDDPLTVVAAFEAFIGLLIEVTFIATLTQRLFGK